MSKVKSKYKISKMMVWKCFTCVVIQKFKTGEWDEKVSENIISHTDGIFVTVMSTKNHEIASMMIQKLKAGESGLGRRNM